MVSRDEKRRRRGIARDLREAERREQLSRLPISVTDLLELMDMLEESVFERLPDGRIWAHCDHTTRRTAAFLSERGLSIDATLAWLEEFGGFCDCEVNANVGGQWEEYLRRPPEPSPN